jgi:hypothetical protein
MADPLVISILSDKRAGIAGQIADLERQAAELRASLMHLDATLLPFDPDAVPAAIPPRGVARKNGLFGGGDISGACMAAIRESAGPVGSRETALRLMASKGLNTTDKKLRHAVQTSVRSALMAYRRRGVLESVGEGWTTRWRLAGGK